jgi:rod shape-determining protein MreC
MRRLLDILGFFREYLLLAFFVIVSIALLATNDTTQVRRIRAITIASLGYLQDAFGFIPGYFELRRENRSLRELNVTLSDESSRLREASLENIRLRRLLALKERSPYRYAAADVVGKNLQLLRNTITIDAGSVQGVAVNMPIVTDAGLVGRVTGVSTEYAVGQIMLNKEFRASAKVQRARVDGIIAWNGGERLRLLNVAKTLDVRVGDVVITSEYSSVYPPGIRIGVVAGIRHDPSSLFQNIEITPAVDFARLEEVFVIIAGPDTARTALESPPAP